MQGEKETALPTEDDSNVPTKEQFIKFNNDVTGDGKRLKALAEAAKAGDEGDKGKKGKKGK